MRDPLSLTNCQAPYRLFIGACVLLVGAVSSSPAGASVVPDYSGLPMSVTASWSGTNVNYVDPGTSVSLTNFTIGQGTNEALYVVLTSQATALTSPACFRNGTDAIKLVRTYSWNSGGDTIYVFYRGHGNGYVLAGTEPITCSWSNAATVVIGAASFRNVDTYLAEFASSIVTASGTSSAPAIQVSSAPTSMTLAVMMRDTHMNVMFDNAPQSPVNSVWAYNTSDAHNGVASQGAGAPTVTHTWALNGPAPWYAVGIDIPAAQSNFIDVWLQGTPAGSPGAKSVSLSTFVVGSGTNEVMFVGITAPGALSGLIVVWDSAGNSPQDMSQVDDFAIPNGFAPACARWAGPPWTCLEYGTSTQGHLYWYSLAAPHPGNKTLSVSWTNDLSNSLEPLVDVGAISFSGVNQSVPALHISHSSGVDTLSNSVDSLLIPTAVGNQTLALWGSVDGDACNWNQTPNWPHAGHGINSDSSRADGTLLANLHSITHYVGACGLESAGTGIGDGGWGMSGLDVQAAP